MPDSNAWRLAAAAPQFAAMAQNLRSRYRYERLNEQDSSWVRSRYFVCYVAPMQNLCMTASFCNAKLTPSCFSCRCADVAGGIRIIRRTSKAAQESNSAGGIPNRLWHPVIRAGMAALHPNDIRRETGGESAFRLPNVVVTMSCRELSARAV